MFERNVFAFLEIIRHLLKKRLINEGASILALSSVSSIKGLKSKSVYSASKAALDAAIRGIAAELSSKKIRVNSIQKGWVSSDMNLGFIKSNTAISESDDFSRQLLGAIEPEELANLVTFLLSDAVKTLTGQAIVLDGGYTL
jgi:NAD(P)-dependent dehydrogenase (short-subunit alcohol dehydrogenase family)